MSFEDDLSKFEQQLKTFTIAGASGSFEHGFVISGATKVAGEESGGGGPPPPPATGACCLPNGTCSILSADDCAVASGDYQGDDSTCDLCPCPRFTVSIHFEISNSSPFGGVNTISADFTRVSDPTTASLGGQDACTMFEAWSDEATYNCGGDDLTLTLDSDSYSLGRLGSDWLLSVSLAASASICGGDNIAFQPSDFVGSDPTGTHVYTLDAFSGALHFTITVDITPYP